MKQLIELVVGDLDEKRSYHRLNERARILPKDYYAAFKKMRSYLYTRGGESVDLEMLSGLLDLLESGAVRKEPVTEVVGPDPAAFCDELILSANPTHKTMHDKLNQEIEEYFEKRQEEDNAKPPQEDQGR